MRSRLFHKAVPSGDAPAGGSPCRFIDLRHSIASRALALGESLPMIGKLLGNRQVQFEAIGEALAEGENVRIGGFGTFTTRNPPARSGRSPRTGESVSIPASSAPLLKAGKTLRNAVNGRWESGVRVSTERWWQASPWLTSGVIVLCVTRCWSRDWPQTRADRHRAEHLQSNSEPSRGSSRQPWVTGLYAT